MTSPLRVKGTIAFAGQSAALLTGTANSTDSPGSISIRFTESLPITIAGLAGFVLSEFQTVLHSISFVGWMVLPAGGFVHTARELPEAAFVYLSGAVLSISLVVVGQTAGILDASLRDKS